LGQLLKRNRSGIAAADLLGFIARIVRSDRELAFVAIQDAANKPHDQRKLGRAIRLLAEGDRDAANRKAKAIGDYGQAWKIAGEASRGQEEEPRRLSLSTGGVVLHRE
jgi:hypothetical protein